MVKDARQKSASSCLSLRLPGTTVIGTRHRDASRDIRKLIRGPAVSDCVSAPRTSSEIEGSSSISASNSSLEYSV